MSRVGNTSVFVAALGLAFVSQIENSPAATFTTYSSQSAFQTALDLSFTLYDFDTLTDGSGVVPHDTRFLAYGLDVIRGDSRAFVQQTIVTYPANQGPGPTVAVMFNGSSTMTNDDDFAVNFVGGVNGFGFAPNQVDGGVIRYYSGENLTGVLLGEAVNNGSGSFVGAISDMIVRSALITCDFNGDYTCGVTDLQFGTASAAVPLPAALPLLLSAMGGLGLIGRRRKRVVASTP